MVCAVKYDSPQLWHAQSGMLCITRRSLPRPKLLVTCLSCTLALPQWAHGRSAEVNSDDDESASWGNLDDCFGCVVLERGARDDVLGFASLDVSLPLDDLAREDDIFEVED